MSKTSHYILVPIDFSDNSIHALEYAIMIANALHLDIGLIHVKTKHAGYSSSYNSKEYNDIITNEISDSVNSLKKKYTKKLRGEIDCYVREGKVYNEICNQAKYTDARLIIMGTHGVSGFEERWVGSNAFRVVSHAPCPVITIRSDYKIATIRKIIMPIDVSQKSRMKVPYVAKLAKIFKSKIIVTDVRDSNRGSIREKLDEYTEQVMSYLYRKDIDFTRKSIKDKHQSDRIIEYAQQANADMISMIIDQQDTTRNFLLSANTQQMVNHSPIPVLSIRDESGFL